MRLRRRHHQQPDTEATRSRIEAEASLERAKARTPQVRELARSLVEIQRKNHLGEHIASIYGGTE